MSKVYIITYHCPYNVGAMLQCYALSKKVSDLGFDVEVIDYRDPKVRHNAIDLRIEEYKTNKFKIHLVKLIYYLYRILKFYPNKEKRYLINFGDTLDSFSKFMLNKLPLTSQTYSSLEDLDALSYEDAVFITGSDQVWNPLLCDNPLPYLLDFVKSGKKNSYAASFGSNFIDEEYAFMLAEKLNDFSLVSVRESSGVDIVKQHAKKDSVHVLDPVFLVPYAKWKKLVYKPKVCEPYIFLYCMESNPLISKKIVDLKRDNPNLKVVRFDGIRDDIEADYYLPVNGPLDFLSYLFGSECVVTNSFHGTAFSVIANKQAYVVPHSIYNERISSLINLLNYKLIDGCYILGDNNLKNLEDMISFSTEFLKTICNQ